MSEIFESNGFRYNRGDGLVLLKIKDTKTMKYIGLDFIKNDDTNTFIIDKVYFTDDEEKGFIFMLDENIFNKYGITTIIEMLKSEDVVLPLLNISCLAPLIV